MPRINTPKKISKAPAAARPLLTEIKKKRGDASNMARMLANSPAALNGFFGLQTALNDGVLSRALQELIGIAVAQLNGCAYCLDAHLRAAAALGLPDEDIAAALHGRAPDARTDAALSFSVKIARDRGAVSDGDIAKLKVAGYGDAAIVEIIAQVGLHTLKNYMNRALETEMDAAPDEKAA